MVNKTVKNNGNIAFKQIIEKGESRRVIERLLSRHLRYKQNRVFKKRFADKLINKVGVNRRSGYNIVNSGTMIVDEPTSNYLINAENKQSGFPPSTISPKSGAFINNLSVDGALKKRISSPFSDKTFTVSFHSSNYLKSPNDLWKLIAILGEKKFEQTLRANHSTVNERVIQQSFQQSNQFFYISKKGRKFTIASMEVFTKKYPDLMEIKLADCLQYINVSQIETLIEKGEIDY
jgi:hypothetical protein